MIYISIGLIVGIIMGLTGAGGAMISIPLFMGLLSSSLKEATVLSLLAVMFGTSVNLLGQLKEVNRKIAITLSAAGSVSNYLTLSLKSLAPDLIIVLLLSVIGIYSLWSVWKRSQDSSSSHDEMRVIPRAILAGLLLGLVTTLTGLGGGVILVPILMNFFGKSYQEALPTSLATILLVSLTSFFLQLETAMNLISIPQLGFIGLGAVLAFIFLKITIEKLDESKIHNIRKIVFTSVTLFSVISVIIKAM